ncbi:MAG: DUF4350 domain-containing protein [Candidatus Heimdallarchaeota archaeon]|nr:DUF4350 domain-containing protein [Candidatus Heimdallarchaeota archaeon]MBY8993225.1 DUF4350 domain-containing protein [Candidatus Heimdallarchaeota archaeon]
MVTIKFNRNTFILSIIFIIFCLPIILSVTRIGQEGTRQFSIYNEYWDGTSDLRENLEGEGFEFHPVVSTLNSLTRLDGNEMGVLAIIGPTIFFDPTETAALAYFIMRGGSVIIADDFGRANDILGLVNTIIAPFISQINASELGFATLPIAGLKINKSLLMDAYSYHKSPVMPVIRNFPSLPGSVPMNGVSRVVTSFPSSISFLGIDNATGETQWYPRLSISGVPIASGIAVSSNFGWLEKDVEKAKDGEYYPDDDEWKGSFSLMVPIPLGGLGVGNILICSDPSIFINELMGLGYDNAQFASNIFNWLDFNSTGRIYYDESHLSSSRTGRFVLGVVDPFEYVRMYLRYVNSFTMFPLLAPLFPFITFMFLRRRYPKSRGPSPLLMTKVKRNQSRSFFAAKMTWYMNYQQFSNALDLIYKRLKRRMVKKYAVTEELSSDKIVELLDTHFPNQFNLKDADEMLKRVELIIQKSRKISEEEFTDLVLDLKNLEETTTRSRM